MSNLQTIEKGQIEDVLAQAVAQYRRATLTHNGPRGWRMYKSFFESLSVASRTLGFKVQIPSKTPGMTMPQPGDTLGITFRAGHKKCLFAARLDTIERKGLYHHVSMRWPERMSQIQRRVCERATPPKPWVISVHLFREREPSGQVATVRNVRYGQLQDLSAGGLNVKAANTEEFAPGSTFRCVFAPTPGQPPLTVEALVRHHEDVLQGRASIGFQFAGLETTANGQQILESLVGAVRQFQKVRLRR